MLQPRRNCGRLHEGAQARVAFCNKQKRVEKTEAVKAPIPRACLTPGRTPKCVGSKPIPDMSFQNIYEEVFDS